MIRPGALLAVVLAVLFALGGCRRPAPKPAARRTVHDELGRALSIPSKVERVISLAPSTTEILYAIGAGGLLVGLDRYSDFPPAARRVARVGSNLTPSLERILALRPDLVFSATTSNTEATAVGLGGAGVPVFVSRARRLDEIFADIAAIGDAVGKKRAADELNAKLRQALDALRARVAGRPKVRMLVVVWPDPLIVAGRSSHVEDLIEAAGGENAVDDSDKAYPTYSLERLIARAPAVIVIGTHASGAPAHGPFERLKAVPAVRDHRVYTVDGDLLFRPGPRVIEGARALARLIHPEAMK